MVDMIQKSWQLTKFLYNSSPYFIWVHWKILQSFFTFLNPFPTNTFNLHPSQDSCLVIVCVFVCVCVWGGGSRGDNKVFWLHFDFSVIWVNNALICIFLIYSDSVQKMLTALFIQISLEYSENYVDKYQGKVFLNIGVLKHHLIALFSTFLKERCQIFIDLELEKYNKIKLA